MKDAKFYIFLTLYLIIFSVIAVITFEAISKIVGTIDN